MHGQTVCRMHGGKAPQALAKADERMKALIHPAISSLAQQIQDGDFQATRYVLDWAGFKMAERVESTGSVKIEVELVDRPLSVLNGRIVDVDPA